MTGVDLLGAECNCGLGTYVRNHLGAIHKDPPGTLRCSFCRIPVVRIAYPKLEALKAKNRAKFRGPNS